ncbi:hypothetical protein PRIPAC_94893 [Pristionchus pacificus]|uniref:Uncharacterized protein n=1 Tax=Pristionchus pacificus TaxID=54126 RepID=A0A2A6C9R8_PRIPA|nr:hypothetical protein PRIPAC_94893 [Pristionchus pacificus]|eukprot:PDM74771.1 hypothetical protein PRIPAC_43722 [Pristionchus pacificus]
MDALRRAFGCKSNRINAPAPERAMEEGAADNQDQDKTAAVQQSIPFNHPLEMGRLAATRYGPPIPSGRPAREQIYVQHPSAIPEAVQPVQQQLQLDISDPVQPPLPPPLSAQLAGIREYAERRRATSYDP